MRRRCCRWVSVRLRLFGLSVLDVLSVMPIHCHRPPPLSSRRKLPSLYHESEHRVIGPFAGQELTHMRLRG